MPLFKMGAISLTKPVSLSKTPGINNSLNESTVYHILISCTLICTVSYQFCSTSFTFADDPSSHPGTVSRSPTSPKIF